MITQDIDKTVKSLQDALVILPDVLSVKNKRISMIFGYLKVLFKHGVKAIRFIKNLKEISLEIIDIDPKEAEIIYNMVAPKFGGSKEVKEDIKKIVSSFAGINQGVQGLVKHRKK